MKQPESKQEQTAQDADDINLLDYWRVIVKHKKLIRNLFLSAVIITTIITFFMTKIYRSQTTLMPVAPSSSQGLMSQLSALPFAGALMGSTAASNPLLKIFNVLISRSIRENIINSLDLKKVFFKEKWNKAENKWNGKEPLMEDTIRILNNITSISKDDKSGLVAIAVVYKDPEFAAKVANQFTAELQNLLNEKTFSIAKKNRIEIEKELVKTKEQLKETEEKLTRFQEQSKVLAIDAQTEAFVKGLADLKSQLISKEIQLGVLRQYSTEKNPDVLNLSDQVRELKKQISIIESGLKDRSGNPDKNDNTSTFPSLREAPEIGLSYLRLKREALINEKVYEVLSQQYELAKIDENKESTDFVIIDKANVPEKKYKPKRLQMIVIAGITSIFIGIFLSFLIEYFKKSM